MKKIQRVFLSLTMIFLIVSSDIFSEQRRTQERLSQRTNRSNSPSKSLSRTEKQQQNPLASIQSPPISPSWQSRHSDKYTGMVAGDYDGDGYDEIVFDFGSQGIWIYDPNESSKWIQIHTVDPDWMIAARFDSTSEDELLVRWASGAVYRWNHNGYPGVWYSVFSTPAVNWMYDAGDIGDGDAAHEVIAEIDGVGTYAFDYTGSGLYGGFNTHWIEYPEPGMAIKLGDTDDYELIHDFDEWGLKIWDYDSGYPTHWTRISWNDLQDDNVACDVDGMWDEFFGDYGAQGVWMYKYGSGWTRINWSEPCGVWPFTIGLQHSNYHLVYEFCGPWIGLWYYIPSSESWHRISWNNPDSCLGADVASTDNGGNSGEELIGDFGSLGMWIQYEGLAPWYRINWSDPEAFIRANLDSDTQVELVVDFGSSGVWVWDQDTDTWTRISYENPESNSPMLGDDPDQ